VIQIPDISPYLSSTTTNAKDKGTAVNNETAAEDTIMSDLQMMFVDSDLNCIKNKNISPFFEAKKFFPFPFIGSSSTVIQEILEHVD